MLKRIVIEHADGLRQIVGCLQTVDEIPPPRLVGPAGTALLAHVGVTYCRYQLLEPFDPKVLDAHVKGYKTYAGDGLWRLGLWALTCAETSKSR